MKNSKGGYLVANLMNLRAALTNSGSFCRFFISDQTSDLRFIRITENIESSKYLKIGLFALILLFIIVPVNAVPTLIDFQGKLTDNNNNPQEGELNMTFRILNESSGGALLWNENKLVNVTDSLFSTLLGSNVPVNLTFGEDYYIEVDIGGETFTPRYRVATVPYAFRANISENARASSISSPSFVIRAIASQTSNLFEWRDSSGAILGYINSTGHLNASLGISCGMITGGDADFCADDTTTGTSNDNTTQNNLITSNNNTLTNLKANLTTFNNFTGIWNWFANITADQGNFTRDIFIAGVAVYARLNGNNQTLLDLITGNNNTLGSRIAGNNQTLTDRIDGNNNTIYGSLGTKVNLTASSSVQCSSGEYLGNATLLGGLITVSKCFNQTGASDNTTQADAINTKANLTDLTNANNTIYGSLGQKVNITDAASNNNTIYGSLGTKVNLTASSSRQCTSGEYIGNVTTLGGIVTSVICYNQSGADDNTTQAALLGQKLNLTGGTLSGLLTIGNISAVNNLSLNVSGALYVNSSSRYVGIGTNAPTSPLHILSGNNVAALLVEKPAGGNSDIGITIMGDVDDRKSLNLGGGAGTDDWSIWADGTVATLFFTNEGINGPSRLSITAAGLVGIGIDTPRSLLHVAGNATINGTLFIDGFNVSARIAGNNQTLTDRIDGNNNTIYGSLGTKVNLTASSSRQCTSGEYIGNVTTLGGLITVS